MADVEKAKKVLPPCPHDETEPAERERWRRCLDCFQVVHRSETAHYRRIAKGVVPGG